VTTAAVVLAAGGGSRFAGPTNKLTAPFRGRPLVVWAVDHALAAGLDETVVVAGAVDLGTIVPDEVTLLHNPRWSEGQAGSLRVAIDWCERRAHAAAVVGLGDQPLVPTESWRLVADNDTRPIVTATFGGERRPPVRLAREVWAALPVSGDEGARALMRRRPHDVAEVPCPGEAADVDTLEDLSRWS
jgi:CTP:molybdopterin cytidylyltransferase MocA